MQIDERAFTAAIEDVKAEYGEGSCVSIQTLKALCVTYEAAKTTEQPVECSKCKCKKD